MRENRKNIEALLLKLYERNQVKELLPAIWRQIESFKGKHQQLIQAASPNGKLTERDSILIVYGDQFKQPECSPLNSLATFLQGYIGDGISHIHLLPFYPSSSDDGFSVIDYRQVSPDLGTWQDISRLEENYHLMFDLEINHVSSQSAWFQKFLQGVPPYSEYFHVIDSDVDLSGVVRPRLTPVLTAFQTSAGLRHVWTTFSADQIDLNYASPQLLLEMVDIFLSYVARGAQIIRLDAIAYVWKIPGTTCIHLPQAHILVKLFRAILDVTAPSVLLITETNVPHQENISYFGDYVPAIQRSDEAQMVYQFPLAPLILHTFITGDATHLTAWAKGLPELDPGTTFLNFTASHDGIGIRPVEGLLKRDEIQALVDRTISHGGLISYGSNRAGERIAYELNITWFDALNDPSKTATELDIRRFLSSQVIMLSLAGVPGIYIHSLLGSHNCMRCLNETGRNRSVNREKFQFADLQRELADPNSLKYRILTGYRQLLQIRKKQPALHPAAGQQILNLDSAVFALVRRAGDGTDLICLTNVTSAPVRTGIRFSDWNIPDSKQWIDLLTDETFSADQALPIALEPYQSRWLRALP